MICVDVSIRYDTMCIDNVMILHGQRRGYNGVYNSQKWKLTPSGKKRPRVATAAIDNAQNEIQRKDLLPKWCSCGTLPVKL